MKSTKPSFLSTFKKLSRKQPRKYQYGGEYGIPVQHGWKVKDMMACAVRDILQKDGWKIVGQKTFPKGNYEIGFVKAGENIAIEDTGKFPYYLGDTLITIRSMTSFVQMPREEWR